MENCYATHVRNTCYCSSRHSGQSLDKLIAGLEANITQGGGSIKSLEKLGRRKLAYTVKKFNDGNYVLLTINADGSLVGEIERRLRVSEPVIKFISVRMDEGEREWPRSRPSAPPARS